MKCLCDRFRPIMSQISVVNQALMELINTLQSASRPSKQPGPGLARQAPVVDEMVASMIIIEDLRTAQMKKNG